MAMRSANGIVAQESQPGLQLAMLPYKMLKLATTPPSIYWGATCRVIDSLYTAKLTQDVSSHLNQERTSYGFQNAGTSEGN